MSTAGSDARLNFRLSSELKETIEQAAAELGQSVSDFAVSTLVQSARKVLWFNRSGSRQGFRQLHRKNSRCTPKILASSATPKINVDKAMASLADRQFRALARH